MPRLMRLKPKKYKLNAWLTQEGLEGLKKKARKQNLATQELLEQIGLGIDLDSRTIRLLILILANLK